MIREFRAEPINCYKFTIGKYKNIACSETSCKCPAKFINIERVCRRSRNSLAIYTNMDKLISFIDVGLSNFLDSYLACSFIFWQDLIADFNFFYRFLPVLGGYKRTGNKAVRSLKISKWTIKFILSLLKINFAKRKRISRLFHKDKFYISFSNSSLLNSPMNLSNFDK